MKEYRLYDEDNELCFTAHSKSELEEFFEQEAQKCWELSLRDLKYTGRIAPCGAKSLEDAMARAKRYYRIAA